MKKEYDIYYVDTSGEILSIRVSCIDKSQARRIFYQKEIDGKLLNVVEVEE